MDLLGSLRGDFENLAYDLLQSAPPPRLTEATPSLMLFTFPAGMRVVLFKYVPGEDAQMTARIKSAVKLGIDEIAIVGGPPAVAKLGAPTQGIFSVQRARFVHVADPPRVDPSISGLGRGLKSPLGKILQRGITAAPSDEAFSAAIQRGLQGQRAISAEAHEFSQVLRTNKPIATYSIAAAIIAMFLLELALGGSEKTQVLIRLGALVPSRLHDEPWRLFTAAFLHIGYLHIILNTYVLIVIGTLLERIIGTWRFLVIYWIAVLCGSLMSAWTGSAGIEAGASGGVIGLLAAESVLAFVPRGLLPQEILPGMRRAALTNLIINVVNSLRPGISLTAHLGGALAGAALIFAPFFTAGLPKLGETAPAGQTKTDRLPIWMKPLAILGIALMAISLGFAFARGGAFELLQGTKWASAAVGETGISVQIPEGFEPHTPRLTPAKGSTVTDVVFGDLREDAAQITVRVIEFPAAFPPGSAADELAELKKVFGNAETGFQIVDAPWIVRRGDRDLVLAVEKRDADDLRFERAGTIGAAKIVIVSCAYQAGETAMRASAERVLSSITGL